MITKIKLPEKYYDLAFLKDEIKKGSWESYTDWFNALTRAEREEIRYRAGSCIYMAVKYYPKYRRNWFRDIYRREPELAPTEEYFIVK